MINKYVLVAAILPSLLSGIAKANSIEGLSIGAGYVEARTLYFGHTGNGGLLEAGYDFSPIYSIDTKIVKTNGDEFDLIFLGLNIGHTFKSSWVRAYGKLGVAEITAKDSHGYKSREEYENSASSRRSNFAIGAGVRFTPFSDQRGTYSKLEILAETGVPLYSPIGIFLTIGYKF